GPLRGNTKTAPGSTVAKRAARSLTTQLFRGIPILAQVIANARDLVRVNAEHADEPGTVEGAATGIGELKHGRVARVLERGGGRGVVIEMNRGFEHDSRQGRVLTNAEHGVGRCRRRGKLTRCGSSAQSHQRTRGR